MLYKIVRHFANRQSRTVKRNLTLQEAQAHCKLKESSSNTARSNKARRYTEKHGAWFDGFTEQED